MIILIALASCLISVNFIVWIEIYNMTDDEIVEECEDTISKFRLEMDEKLKIIRSKLGNIPSSKG